MRTKAETVLLEQNRKLKIALRWALKYAKEWRGALVGNPDMEPLRKFDKKVKYCETVLSR